MKRTTFTVIIAIALVTFGCKSRKQDSEAKEVLNKEQTADQETRKESSEYDSYELNNKESSELAEMILISQTKTPCFGVCPSFSFTVFANGMAQYIGHENVKLKGKYKAKIAINEINQLLKEAASMSYFSLNNKYDNELITDLPSTITYLNLEGKEKKVICRYECDERIKKN